MTTTINASTSSGLVVTPDNSGNIVLQYNGVAAPAFSAYASSNTTLTVNTATKVQFQVKEFDTANAFDNATNYRFQPPVAGYYQISTVVQYGGSVSSPTAETTSIYKNGAVIKRMYISSTNYGQATPLSALIYLNGSTDYVEIYAQLSASSGSPVTNAGQEVTWFQGVLVRGA
jgi:hypothetical protein